ncbi:MAG: hypothetical protein ACRD3S_07845, partial [Terracidiphilus sp.]
MNDATFCFVLERPPHLISSGGDVEALLGYSHKDFQSGSVRLQERIHREDADLAEALFAPEAAP